jgi:ATP-dependent protease HslVU (ClpYQ) peptidase subunit
VSLAIALHQPGRYAIAADTRLVRGPADMHTAGPKTFRRGPWLGAWCGSLPDAQTFLRALTDVHGDTFEDGEGALFAAWDAAATKRGTKSSGGDPWLDLDLLLVGPPGILRLSGFGSVTREPGVAAIGCGDGYALGWLDRGGTPTAHDITRAIEAAARRYPGIGGPVDVLTSDTLTADAA